MTEHDDVIDLLRRAKPAGPPEELVSPHAPAAQALVEEILSMQTVEPESEIVAIPRPRRRRRVLAMGLAAAGAAAAVAAVSIVVSPVEPSEATPIEAALAQSTAALDVSGRAEVTWEITYEGQVDNGWVDGGVDLWEFSGDDSSVTLGVPGLADDEAPINRIVDGEFYAYLNGETGEMQWFHDINGDPSGAQHRNADPSTLLAQLAPAGEFEDIGEDTVDGVPTRRLRATNPGETPTLLPNQDDGEFLGEVTNLEVWVDDDGYVRRVDLAYGGQGSVAEASTSIRFFDFGEPITIEAPIDAVDHDPAG